MSWLQYTQAILGQVRHPAPREERVVRRAARKQRVMRHPRSWAACAIVRWQVVRAGVNWLTLRSFSVKVCPVPSCVCFDSASYYFPSSVRLHVVCTRILHRLFQQHILQSFYKQFIWFWQCTQTNMNTQYMRGCNLFLWAIVLSDTKMLFVRRTFQNYMIAQPGCVMFYRRRWYCYIRPVLTFCYFHL